MTTSSHQPKRSTLGVPKKGYRTLRYPRGTAPPHAADLDVQNPPPAPCPNARWPSLHAAYCYPLLVHHAALLMLLVRADSLRERECPPACMAGKRTASKGEKRCERETKTIKQQQEHQRLRMTHRQNRGLAKWELNSKSLTLGLDLAMANGLSEYGICLLLIPSQLGGYVVCWFSL